MLRTLAVLTFALSMAGAVLAETIFSNLGVDDTYDCCYAWSVYGAGAPIQTDRGSSFVPLAAYTLDSVDAAFNWYGGNRGGYLWLMSDNSGVPGVVVESFHFDNLPAAASAELVTGVSTLHPLLSPGLRYWLVASADPGAFLGMGWNNTGGTGLVSRDNQGPWGFNPDAAAGAFRVLGTVAAVPEPQTYALMLGGLAALTVVMRRRKQG